MMVPAVTVNWYLHDAHWNTPGFVEISGTFFVAQRGQTAPSGQRIPSSTSRHFASQLYLSIKVIRSMAQPPKKKRRKLPRDLLDRSDHDVMEHVFGKRGMRHRRRIGGRT